MVYGYARVSTKGQAKDGNSLEAQIKILEENGAEKIYTDSFTGTKTDRPQFTELLNNIKEGDKLIVTKLDRFARTARDGMETIQKLMNNGVVVHVLNMGLIDNTPTGKLIAQVMLAFAEFERDMIVERTQEGKAIARQKVGYKEGRPQKYTQAQLDNAIDLLEQGNSYTKVTEITGISKSTLIREKRKRDV